MNHKDNLNSKEKNAIVIGLQFGDEGKGKIVDLLAEDFDCVARFQGGDNAGHTIVIDGITHKLSLIPSGVFHNKIVVLGSGVAINPYKLKEELLMLEKYNIKLEDQLFVSDNASIIFSINRKLDLLNEKLRSSAIGTTGKGIGITYTHRVARNGIRVCDLFLEREKLFQLIYGMINEYEILSKEKFNIEEIWNEIETFKEILKPFIVNSGKFFIDMMKDEKRILFEGAQGCGLDVSHGTYPFVTSSSTFAANVSLGAPISFRTLGKVYGILKSYSTRVGNGILVTENYTDLSYRERMLRIGKEFGTVTGRQRRCGWLDLVATKTYIDLNGVNSIILTKIDVLDGFKELKICIKYEKDGITYDYLPSIIDGNINPIFETFDGWNELTAGITDYSKLPKNAKKYIEFIENFLQTKIEIISTGVDRNDILRKLKF